MSGSDFARRQLKKHGWTEGAGLGKQEDGRSEPIKVSLKMDKTGVGHDPGKEFTDHWWLRVFNEAAQKIGESNQEADSSDDEEKKRKEKMAADKKNFYKGFVKSSTLTNGIEEKDKNSDSDSNDESNVVTNTRIPTLDDIHKFCGGATGHRAARFGIKMKGKLSRVAEHDQKFEEKMKTHPSSKCTDNVNNLEVRSTALDITIDETHTLKEKKRKSKKKKRKDENETEMCTDDVQHSNNEISELNSEGHSKKKKKKHREETEDLNDTDGHLFVSRASDITTYEVFPDSSNSDKSKKKKKRKKEDVCIEIQETKSVTIMKSCTQDFVDGGVLGDFDINEHSISNSESSSDKEEMKRKRKKKKDKIVVASQEHGIQDEEVQKVKKRKKGHQEERIDSDVQDVTVEKSSKKKKKKKGKAQ